MAQGDLESVPDETAVLAVQHLVLGPDERGVREGQRWVWVLVVQVGMEEVEAGQKMLRWVLAQGAMVVSAALMMTMASTDGLEAVAEPVVVQGLSVSAVLVVRHSTTAPVWGWRAACPM